MNDLTINPALARKRINNINSRLERYPNHPARERMEERRDAYQAALEAGPGTAPDRLLSRIETLITSVRKIDAALDADFDHPNKSRMLVRRAEYQTSITNIQEYGRERMPKKLQEGGVNIEVPTDVLVNRSE